MARLALLPLPSLLRLPTLCAVCRGWSAQRICAPCIARFAPPTPRCPRCALPLAAGSALCAECLRQPPPFAQACAAVDYAFPWAGLVQQLKFHAALDLVDALAALLSPAIAAAAASAGPPALVLPMPLAPQRLRERGFNQAGLLAKALARAHARPLDARLLRRVVETPHLAALPRERRAQAVRGVFALDARRGAALAGLRVALVDDVMTTGASAAEAARVLLAAGAAAVQVWVVARTPAPD